MPGPPPKHPSQRRRRNATPALTQLPAEGRQGKTPTWPLGPDIVTRAKLTVAQRKVAGLEAAQDAGEDVSQAVLDRATERVEVLTQVVAIQRKTESTVWRVLWSTPMAAAWERLGYVREIALFVRHQVLAENGDLNAAKEARMRADRLGLSPLALLKLRWEISADEVGQRRTEAAPAAEPAAPRTRFRVVDSSAG